MARVFTAVDIEDKDVLEQLSSIRDRLDLGFNTVEEEKMHVTLQFFSDASEDEIEEIKAAMDEIEMESFEAELEGVGVFPSYDYIRVVWAGIGNGRFHELYDQASQHEAIADNNHEFSPHVTLMRVKDLNREEKRKLQRMINDYQDQKFGKITVNEVKLFRSDLGPEGSVYTDIHSRKI
ncbi:MAG: RNA 2',3'-cyclic phosphodiesterase [Candidatus Nanohaloarchaea archaeon]